MDIDGNQAALVCLDKVQVRVHGLTYSRGVSHVLGCHFSSLARHVVAYVVYHGDVPSLGLLEGLMGCDLMDSKGKGGGRLSLPKGLP